mmetsp:Transcript_41194/g.108843  ORF Transcript_41194/g.108843 Transcript_41194/m.108843 type:complete len:134 (-) Transcript_41194:245-646(-)
MQVSEKYGDAKTPLGIFLSNAHPTDDAEQRAALERVAGSSPSHSGPVPSEIVSSAVFKLISRINHSCAPNASLTWLRGAMLVRAVKPIEAGDEVLLNYIGVEATGHPAPMRRAYLRSQFGFLCRCELCEASDV